MGEDNWYESIPEPLRTASFFKPGDDGKPKPLEQVIADINGAAAHLGNSIRIPGPDAGDEDVARFRLKAVEKIPGLMVVPSEDDEETMTTVLRSMGMPEKPDGYKLPEIEGVDWSNVDTGGMRAQAHAMGMTQRQFAAMVKAQHEERSTLQERQTHELQEGLSALRKEWGSAFDERVSKVRATLENMDAPDYLMSMLEAGTLPAADIAFFHKVADAIGAEGSEGANQERNAGTLTPDQALDALSELENRADRALFDAAHPDHERLVKRRLELMKLAYPESDTGNLRSSFGG